MRHQHITNSVAAYRMSGAFDPLKLEQRAVSARFDHHVLQGRLILGTVDAALV